MSAAARCAIDTSVAVPLVLASHTAHPVVRRWAAERALVIPGHVLAETYSVLTRLPGDSRVAPGDAVTLIDDNVDEIVTLPAHQSRTLHRDLSELGVAGGAVYDALIALTARHHTLPLATRDARARSTYLAVGIDVVVVDTPGGSR